MLENDDDYDFNPSDNSKLSSLFGSTPFLTQPTSNNLMYTAPKQPAHSKSQENTEKQSNATKVILIRIISLWKSDQDKNYKPLGKHGLAIIGAKDLNAYELIAYKNKANTVLKVKINSQFRFQQKKDNYSSFFDSSNHNWLVRFDAYEQQIEFGEYLKTFGATIILEANEIKDEQKTTKPDILLKPVGVLNKPDLDNSDSVKKAKILCRITKMGQPVVPKHQLPLIENDIPEDFESNENKNMKIRKIKKIDREEETVSLSTSTHIVPKSLVSIPQVPIYYTQSPFGDLNSIVLTQNAELKTSLNKISEKLDALNVQKGESQGGLFSKLKVLELQTENLQAELNKYKYKCSDLQLKFSNQSKEEKNDSDLSAEISRLKAKLVEANFELEAAESKIESVDKLNEELEKNRKDISEYQRIIETQKLSLEELDLFYQQFKNTSNTEANIKKLQERIKHLDEKLNSYELRIKNFEIEKQEALNQNNENINVFASLIKLHMNSMYQSILHTFDPDETYTLNDIQSVLARNLKETSFQIINGIKTKLQGEPDV